jgi:hypothetical protein
MARKKAPAPVSLTLHELIDKMIEAKLPFDLHSWPDADDGKWGARVNGKKGMGDDPVTAVLEALAEGVADAEKNIAENAKTLEANRARVAAIKAAIPDLHVHAPEGQECVCGYKHKGAITPEDSRQSLQELMQAMASGAQVSISRVDMADLDKVTAAKKEPTKKKGN